MGFYLALNLSVPSRRHRSHFRSVRSASCGRINNDDIIARPNAKGTRALQNKQAYDHRTHIHTHSHAHCALYKRSLSPSV